MTKNILQSMTIRGALIQLIASVLIYLGYATGAEELANNLVVGLSAVLELVGFIMIYIGRKRATDKIV